MRKSIVILLLASGLLSAQERASFHHLLGTKGPLTDRSSRPVREIARDFTLSTAAKMGVNLGNADSLYVDREYTDAHNGVTHIVYRQQFHGVDVYNAAWSVNIDFFGQVLNAGGDLYGAPAVDPPSGINARKAARAAVTAVNARLGENFQAFHSGQPASRMGAVRFARGEMAEDVEGSIIWYGFRGALYPAWVFYVTDEDGVSRYASVVDDVTSLSLMKQPMTFFQNPSAKGLVYERDSPNPNPKPGTLLTAPPPLADRTIQSFAGDPTASPRGWVASNSTVGNNAVVGENLAGTSFLRNPLITSAKDGNFSFPIQLGPGMPASTEFTDAVNTSLFYWINRAHDLHYLSGFTEAAGNFQADNLGRGGVGGDPVYAYSHYGVQATSRASLRNAFFTYRGHADGSQPMVAMYLSYSGSGGFYTDGALESDVVVHEYTHGVSLRLLPNGYGTFQEGAMGEAWSDFFGLEFTLPDGAPAEGIYTVGEYFFGSWGKGIRTRPYSTDLSVDPLSYAALGSVTTFPEVHADGEIWMAALWDMRANLIKQFGEKEGRRRVRLLVLDGMKFMPPSSTMIDARDAILLADRVDFKGASQDQLWAAFAKRGMGATAYSWSGGSVHISASFELPSNKAKISFYDPEITIGESLRVVVSDNNNPNSSVLVQFASDTGDIETLQLRRVGSVFAGSISTSSNIVIDENGTLNLVPGDFASVYYTDFNTGSGAAQVSAYIPTQPPYFTSGTPAAFDTSGTETTLSNGQSVELPFEFRYFGKTYRRVFVDKNGLLYFSDTATYGCIDTPTLRTVPAIAPFWLQLSVTGTAQAREGIFMRSSTDSVRFRWAAETSTAFGAGTPVNFSATLSRDGAIDFNYGSGNTDLVNAITFSGCLGSTSVPGGPLVGLSPGHDTYLTGVFVKPSWTNATGYHFDPPFNISSIPNVVVESPRPGVHVQDLMTVTGVGYDASVPFSRAYVLIDGVQYGSGTATISRTDFCGQQNVRGCPNIGFSILVNTADLAPGEHKLQVRGVNARGAFSDGPSDPISFTVDPGQGLIPFGKVESPAADAEVSGTLTVRGYAAINGLRITSVDTLIDGITFGPTTYNVARTDICGTLTPAPANCPAIGFTVNINTRTGTPPLQDGDHVLQIRVLDQSGRFTILPGSTVAFKVNNGPYQPPVGAITSIKSGDKLSGTVQLSGYAYAQTGTVRSVIAIYDGLFADSVRYGVASPEVCANLPNVTACPNIGWTLDLDTRRLTNGDHRITVQITDSSGTITTLPSTGQPTVSVNVQN